MNRVVALAHTPLVVLARFDHPEPHDHDDPGEEHAQGLSVSFVERGRFSLWTADGRAEVDARRLFVTRPGLRYRCTHAAGKAADDVCLTLNFAPSAARDLPPPAATIPLTNRLAYLRHAAERAAQDTLALEGAAAAILDEAHAARRGGPLYRAAQVSWYAARIDRARARIEEDCAGVHSLAALADDAGMSPFHFAHVFKELVGTPPHRYVREARLRRAAAMLRDGAGVGEACFGTGFANLGHFTRSFKRRFGVPPSRRGR